MLLSVVIPAYNEANTIEDIFHKVKSYPSRKEIIIVDNGSTDGTWEVTNSFKSDELNTVKILRQDKQRGKGAALNTGFKAVEGDIVIIQDADLEYDPENYPALIKPIESGVADVVYGSRFIGDSRRVFMFSHYLGNRFLSLVANVLFDSIITDISTGYKAFSRSVLDEYLPIMKSKGFEFEVEFTARVLQLGFRVYEVPISYYGRTYDEGKKITWKDGIKYLVWMLRCKLDEDKYKIKPKIGLEESEKIYNIMEKFLGRKILYIGAKNSHIARFLMGRELLVLSGENTRDVRYLKRRFRETSRLKILPKDEAIRKFEFDTIILHSESADKLSLEELPAESRVLVISEKELDGLRKIGDTRKSKRKYSVFERT